MPPSILRVSHRLIALPKCECQKPHKKTIESLFIIGYLNHWDYKPLTGNRVKLLSSLLCWVQYKMSFEYRITLSINAGRYSRGRMVLTLTHRGITELLIPIACGAPTATLGLLRGVRAGWIGRMPDIGWGWAWPALGRWRGAIEVSKVGTGSVILMEGKENIDSWWRSFLQRWKLKCSAFSPHLALVWLFLATASLALMGSGSFAGIDEFYNRKRVCIIYLFKDNLTKELTFPDITNILINILSVTATLVWIYSFHECTIIAHFNNS